MLFCAYSMELSEYDSSLLVSALGFLISIITSVVLSVIWVGFHEPTCKECKTVNTVKEKELVDGL